MCSLHYLNELFGYQTITKWKVVMIYDALFSSYFISYWKSVSHGVIVSKFLMQSTFPFHYYNT